MSIEKLGCEGCPARAVYQHFNQNQDLDPSERDAILFMAAREATAEALSGGDIENLSAKMGPYAPSQQSREPIVRGGISRRDISVKAIACAYRQVVKQECAFWCG